MKEHNDALITVKSFRCVDDKDGEVKPLVLSLAKEGQEPNCWAYKGTVYATAEGAEYFRDYDNGGRERQRAICEAARIAKAKEVPLAEYTMPFVFDGSEYEDVDYFEGEWAWGVTPSTDTPNIADELSAWWQDNGYENCDDSDWPPQVWAQLAEAQKLIDEHVPTTYYADYTVRVMFPARSNEDV